jgi:hypothetical protein
MEKMWLMLAIVTFLIAVYQSIRESIYDAVYFYGFSVIAILLFVMRRQQRRMHERKQNEE